MVCTDLVFIYAENSPSFQVYLTVWLYAVHIQSDLRVRFVGGVNGFIIN